MTKNGSIIGGLVERYEAQPILRGLVQLIPFGVGSALDTAALTRLNNIRSERLQTFFDELGDGNLELTPEVIESEDFLHCYFVTLRAALNTRRREKIRLLARLLGGAVSEDTTHDVDEYEEYLALLDELSYRELLLLSILQRQELTNQRDPAENDLQWTIRHWGQFEEEVQSVLGVAKGELGAMLTRLARTGLWEPYTGTFWDYQGGMGRLTASYARLTRLVGAGVP